MTENEFKYFLDKYNFTYSEKMISQCFSLMRITLTENEKFNLTAIKNEADFLEKMVLDSIIPFYGMDLTDKRIIDFGTGAGFPGLIIKIFFPNAKVDLLDATKKKCEHLKRISKELNIPVNIINERGETFSKNNKEIYDIATARAMAPLNILLEITSNCIKVGGYLYALKGNHGFSEIKEAESASKKLGFNLVSIREDELPLLHEQRLNILYKKMKSTSSLYPRNYLMISKKPL